jgi:cold shock protein
MRGSNKAHRKLPVADDHMAAVRSILKAIPATTISTSKKESVNVPIFGTVKFVSERGFAFLKRDDGQKDVFAHNSEVQRCGLRVPLAVGQRLSFELQDAPRGAVAVNITLAA